MTNYYGNENGSGYTNGYPNNNGYAQYTNNGYQTGGYQTGGYQTGGYGTGNRNGKGKGFAIAGLILGIAAVVFGFLGIISIIFSSIGLVCGIVGIIMAVNASKNEPGPLATAGLIVSIIGLVFAALWFFTCGLCASSLACSACAAEKSMENALSGMYFPY